MDLSAPVDEQLRALEQAWRMSLVTRIQLTMMLEGRQVTGEDFVPLWVAVSGFIVFGAEIVEVGWETGRGKAGTLLRLREAGGWWPQGPDGRSLLGADPRAGRGGSPWQLLERHHRRPPPPPPTRPPPARQRRPGGL